MELRNPQGFSEARIAEIRASSDDRFARPVGARFTANDIIAITREQLPEDGYLFSETGIAQAVGLNGVTVETPEGFAQALRRALSAQTATVIDAQVDPQAYRDSFMVTTGIVP
jgi:hypothetical protein